MRLASKHTKEECGVPSQRERDTDAYLSRHFCPAAHAPEVWKVRAPAPDRAICATLCASMVPTL